MHIDFSATSNCFYIGEEPVQPDLNIDKPIKDMNKEELNAYKRNQYSKKDKDKPQPKSHAEYCKK